MKKETKLLIIRIVNILLIVAAFVFNIIGLMWAETFQAAQMYLNIAACVFSLVYLLLDYKKTGAAFFKVFLSFIVVKEACALINMAIYETIPWYAFLMELFAYTCPFILAIRRDLGKNNSFIVNGVYALLACVSFVLSLVLVPVSSLAGAALAVYNGTRVILAILIFVMIAAKYEDKKERGTN